MAGGGELLTHRTRRSNIVALANDPRTNGSLAASTTFAEQMDLVVGMLAPTDDPEMLGRIGSYEVSGVIGCGGMGVVFKAHDRSLDRVVAIKVMAPHLAGSGAARKRFARESKAAAAVLHPNVIAIHCVADDPKLPYLVMPYIGGTSLQKRVEADGRCVHKIRCGSVSRSQPVWPPHTRRGSCIGILSQQTSCWNEASSE